MLEGKNILITGASKGIGKAIALKLAAQKASIILHCNNSIKQAEETVRQIEDFGGKAFIVQADFENTISIKNMFVQQIEPLLNALPNKGIDVLVNNAGFCERSYLRSFNDEVFDKTFNINFKAPLYMIQLATPYFKNGGGKIINLSSMMVKDPDNKHLLYAASKAALDCALKAVYFELGKKNITINAITPGFIPTNIKEGFSHPMVTEFVTKRTALGRTGSTEDVADLALFLAGPQSNWITGQIIETSGGFK